MAEVIRMPLLSDTMKEGVIAEWHKKVGDKVASDDVIADVETDKATMEVVPYVEGTVLYIALKEGEAAKVNDIIAIIGKEGEEYQKLLDEEDQKEESSENEEKEGKEQDNKEEKEKAPADDNGELKAKADKALKNASVIRMPLLSDTMKEGKIISWNKKVGDKVASDDALADVETDKATMEVVGYVDGTLLHIGVDEGESAKVNDIIAIVGKQGTDVDVILKYETTQGKEEEKEAPEEDKKEEKKQKEAPAKQQQAAPTQKPATTAPSTTEGGRVKASPLAKKLAEDKGIDISTVEGSGDNGRIIKRDIDNYQPPAQQPQQPATAQEGAVKVPTFAPANAEEGYKDQKVSQMRKVIAQRLSESKYTAPHFYLTMEINMDVAMEARKHINEISPVKVSFNDMVIKACAAALRQHPEVNSSWIDDNIRTYKHIHIGSAVAIEDGLIVPVVKFADQKSLAQIAAETKDLNKKAKTKKLQPPDFSGNTFTVSNLGMMDIEEFTAIINPPDSCILAIGKIKQIPIVKDGQIAIGNIMKITLSCDHRVVDGAVGATFLQTLKKYLENPVTMLV